MNNYACHNSTRKNGYYAPVRLYHSDGSFVLVTDYIEDVSSKECRYDQRATDKRCEGCKK